MDKNKSDFPAIEIQKRIKVNQRYEMVDSERQILVDPGQKLAPKDFSNGNKESV